MTEPSTPNISIPSRIFWGLMSESIDEVTALTVTFVNPLKLASGVIFCVEVAGFTVFSCPLSSIKSPSTPKISTPSRIFSGIIFDFHNNF